MFNKVQRIRLSIWWDVFKSGFIKNKSFHYNELMTPEGNVIKYAVWDAIHKKFYDEDTIVPLYNPVKFRVAKNQTHKVNFIVCDKFERLSRNIKVILFEKVELLHMISLSNGSHEQVIEAFTTYDTKWVFNYSLLLKRELKELLPGNWKSTYLLYKKRGEV